MTRPMPETESATPLVVGPLRGYRYWHAKWDGGQPVLRSLYHTTIWPAQGPLHASCEKRLGTVVAWMRRLFTSQPEETHRAPSGTCECGIYALTNFEAIERGELLPQACHPSLDVYVLGAVLLWGRVVQHGQGYRAEYGRPLRLLTTPPLSSNGIRSLLDAIATRYDLSLVTRVEELSAP